MKKYFKTVLFSTILTSTVFTATSGKAFAGEMDYVGVTSYVEESETYYLSETFEPSPFLVISNSGEILEQDSTDTLDLEYATLDDPTVVNNQVDNIFTNNTTCGSGGGYYAEVDCLDANQPGETGSFSKPARVKTSMVDLYGIPFEYAIVKGNLNIFKRPGYYYSTQQATQGYFNLVTAKITKEIAFGFSSFATYKVIDKVPYIARKFDKYNKPKPYNYGDFAKGGAAVMVQENVPFWGKIFTTPIPEYGTKTVIVYVSKSGKDKYPYRISFTIKPDKSITYKKWRLK